MAADGGGPDLVTELTESLRLSRRELKLVRGQQELSAETLQRVRRQRAALGKQVDLFSDVLAALLSEQYWAAQPAPRRGLLGRAGDAPTSKTSSPRSRRPTCSTAAGTSASTPRWREARLSPALDYVRTGHAAGREPGPRFDTARYLREHPDAARSDVPPLVHHLRNGVA